MAVDQHGWDGQWVSDRLGVRLDSTGLTPLPRLVGLALRRNAGRAHLLVSHVLGKHIPLDPRAAYRCNRALGGPARAALDGTPAGLVIGYAETATGLGHAVADELGVACLHSTRRRGPDASAGLAFEESHSHAPDHVLLPTDAALLQTPAPIVLVDDELSTGHTVLNTIRALQRLHARERYVVATLVDVRGPADIALMAEVAAELDTGVEVVCAGRGRVELPSDIAERAAELIAAHRLPPVVPAPRSAVVCRIDPCWPAGLAEGGRHGYPPESRGRLSAAARDLAVRLAEVATGRRVLVLGTEELMHAPMVIAAALADRADAGQLVRFSSTTRSPVVAIDEPGYAIRTALSFAAHEAGATGERYAYNVAPAAGADPFTDIVLVVDTVTDTPPLWAEDGLVARLSRVCERLFVVTLPTATLAA